MRLVVYESVVGTMVLNRVLVRWVAAAYLLVLAFLSLNPWLRPDADGNSDKFDHAIAYAGLTVLIFLCVSGGRVWHARRSVANWMGVAAASFAIGAALEVAQSLFTHNRVGSWADALANAVGVLLGCALFALAAWAYAKWRA